MKQKYTENDIKPILKRRLDAMLDDAAISVRVADYIKSRPVIQTALISQLLDMLNSGKLDDAIRPLNDQTTWTTAIKKVFRIYQAPAVTGGTRHVVLDFKTPVK